MTHNIKTSEGLLKPFSKNASNLQISYKLDLGPNYVGVAFHLNNLTSLESIGLDPNQQTAWHEELWKETCFELFLGFENHYCEWNYCPGKGWAQFFFDGYRQRIPLPRSPALYVPRDHLEFKNSALKLVWHPALLETSWLRVWSAMGFPKAKAQISCVVKDRNETSYWAPQHPIKAPDFHDQNYWLLF